MSPQRKIRVLVVDDSAIVRRILTEALAGEPDLDVVGTAPDAYVARDKILALSPDVLTLDIEMPRMDGLTFLKKLMRSHPLPVIVISSLGQASTQAALDALRWGAVEVLDKPGGPYSVGELRLVLANKIRAAAAARLQPRLSGSPEATAPLPSLTPGASLTHTREDDMAGFPPGALIAIGASTGGTEAIQNVLLGLPPKPPGIVITQHIPAVFSRAFAERLNRICPMEVKEAVDGDLVVPGRALIAPGDRHMIVRAAGGGFRVAVKEGPRVCYQRPSVDVMFGSVAEAAGVGAVAALLTGMGSDGAQGMLRMKNAGAHTIAQDEASCVVFGMPKEAIRLGAAARVLPLDRIAGSLMNAIRRLTNGSR